MGLRYGRTSSKLEPCFNANAATAPGLLQQCAVRTLQPHACGPPRSHMAAEEMPCADASWPH
jgi:hypothetical protein